MASSPFRWLVLGVLFVLAACDRPDPMTVSLVATQTQPAEVLPGQGFDVVVRLANVSSVPVEDVRVREAFQGTSLPSTEEGVGRLAGGEERAVTFGLEAPVAAARGERESAVTYQQRLEAWEGQRLLSEGEVTFANARGEPLTLSSASRLVLPRLTVNLEGPARLLPGQQVTYTLTASNVGTASAVSGNLQLLLSDASRMDVPLEALAPGATWRKDVIWTVPPLPVKQPGESSTEYAARLRALDGQPRQTQVTLSWMDGQGNAYGALGEVTAAALHVEVPPFNTPPRPEEKAPPLPTLSVPSFVDSVSFLYSGDNPIQVEVTPGILDPRRLAVLRGKVLSREGRPLAEVRISLLNHPEYGHTITREDGLFDLAVNGGGLLTVRYEAEGLLPSQRQLQVPPGDFTWLPDVVLVALDPQGTPVDFSGASTTLQVARGSPVTDADGTRQATLLFAPGTQALAVLPNGDEVPLFSATVRATEYTVGETGPAAMPAHLPPISGYTYAVELSLDEALALNSQEVRFTQPVVSYVDNFLGFPVGGPVPAGYYDRTRGLWLPSDNGRILQVHSVVAGVAQLDVTGDGQPDGAAVLSTLGITDAEQRQLAGLYPVGKSLWRVPVNHFTPWDYNWPYGPPLGAQSPRNASPRNGPDNKTNCQRGSIIDCQNQALGESLPIVGAPFRLHYQSDRVPGHVTRSLSIPVSGASVPTSLRSFVVEVSVAGRHFSYTLPAAPQQTLSFTWDGKDAYGRTVQGEVPIKGRTGYLYPVVYLTPAEFPQAFALAGAGPVSANQQQREMTLWQEWGSQLGGWDEAPENLGGWRLSPHHQVVERQGSVLLGYGKKLARHVRGSVISTVAGSDTWGEFGGDGGPATQAALFGPKGIAVGPDGSLYIADEYNHRIRRVEPDGIISTVAGTGEEGFGGDGGPATQAPVSYPWSIALGTNGSLYIAEAYNFRIRRVGPDGIISTVAGTGEEGFGGDGGPATQALLGVIEAIALGPDGSLYIADTYNSRIRRVGPDGIISTVAGTGEWGFGGDGGPATHALLRNPAGLALGPDGSLYISDFGNHRIRRVGPDGIISTVVGTGEFGGSGVGGPATQALIANPRGLSVGPDGSLFFADTVNVLRVDPQGILSIVAGHKMGFDGDGGPATQASLGWIDHIAFGRDGSLYISDPMNGRVRAILQSPWAVSFSEISRSSEDGREIYIFDTKGRHLRSLDSLTGATRYRFGYDTAGRLTSITDGDGLVTRVERDGTGKPLAIVAPHGQRTRLTLDAQGYLASVTNQAGDRVELHHEADGLLTSMRDARGGLHQYTYNPQGRLTKDIHPTGSYKQLARTEAEDGYTVTLSTAQGVTTRYQVQRLPGGGQRRTTTEPDGTRTLSLLAEDESTTSTTSPDGTVTTELLGPDARFGMQAPLLSSRVTLPGGLTSTFSHTNKVSYLNGDPRQGLHSVVNTLTRNGRTYTATYTAASRALSLESPEKRRSTSTLDEQGRMVRRETPGVLPLNYSYDSEGRPWKVTQGERTETYTYDASGYLETVENALGRTTRFSYDPVGRLISQELPGGRTVGISSDAHGNLTGLVPPGRPAHIFGYTASDAMDSYLAPLPLTSTPLSPTRYAYNLDGAFTSTTLPDGSWVRLARDTAGRVDSLTTPRTTVNFGYDAQGRLVTLTDRTGPSLAYVQDGPLMKQVTWSGEIQGRVGYTYTPDLALAALDVQGQSVAYGHDNDGLLTSAGELSLSRRQDNGLLSSTTLGQMRTTQTYTSYGELERLSAAWGTTSLYSLALGRDAAGRIISKREMAQGVEQEWQYTYDAAGRLDTVMRNGSPHASYGYDTNGNRISFTQGGATRTATYDAQDRLQTLGTAVYTFGPNGDLQQRLLPPEAVPTQYVYDSLGALTRVQLPGGTRVDYVVDASNRRVGKRLNGTLVQGLLYDGPLQVVAELDGTGAVVSRFVYASQKHVPDYMIKGGVTYRLLTDHLGSIRLVVNATTGVVAQTLEYGPLGEVLSDSNPGFQPFAFAGGLHDVHSGLTRFGARDYDARTGLWTARDPRLFAGGQLNLYQYALGDPVNRIDPTGLVSIGYSSYAGLGFGFEFAWESGKGRSVCAQHGVGYGGGFEFKPGGGVADPGVTLKTEVSASAMGASIKMGTDYSLSNCTTKPQFGVGIGGASVSVTEDQLSLGGPGSTDYGVKVEGSISIQSCVNF